VYFLVKELVNYGKEWLHRISNTPSKSVYWNPKIQFPRDSIRKKKKKKGETR
jgi:hypothetical protein